MSPTWLRPPRTLLAAAVIPASFALLATGRPALSCESEAALRAALAAAREPAARVSLANAFAACAERAGTPLIEPTARAGRFRALFVFAGEATSLTVAGDLNGWDTKADPLERLAGTDLWLRGVDLPAKARLDYKLVRNGSEWLLDPWNGRTMEGGFGPNSQFWTPGYQPPAEVTPRPGVPTGRFVHMTVESHALGGARRALVYVPPPAPGSGSGATAPPAAPARLPSLYLLDGLDYRQYAMVGTVLDNLVAEGRVPPILLVLVPPLDRISEYERSAAFERFLVEELVPDVDALYPTRRDAAGRGVMGVSLGGFAALNAAVRHPGVFGRCGAQSTGNAVPANLDALLAEIGRLSPSATRFHLDVGTFEERLHGDDLLAVSRRLRDALLARGATLQYEEVPEGHSWGSWRARLADAWTFFWGRQPSPSGTTPHVLPGPPAGAERFSGAPVALDVKDADVHDVIRQVTQGRGFSVVTPPDLKGTVTATLRDVPWDQALDLVLSPLGYGFVVEGKVLRVARREELAGS